MSQKGGGNFPTVQDGPARSVAGPTQGWADGTLTTTGGVVDLEAWAGSYVKVYCEGTDVYASFTKDITLTAANLTVTTATTVGTKMVADRFYVGVKEHFVVPEAGARLVYKATATTGTRRLVIVRS